jgi:hypothetical protein
MVKYVWKKKEQKEQKNQTVSGQITNIVKEVNITNIILNNKKEFDELVEFEQLYGFEFYNYHETTYDSDEEHYSDCCSDEGDVNWECEICEKLMTNDTVSKISDDICRDCYCCESCDKPIYKIGVPLYYCPQCISDLCEDEDTQKYMNDDYYMTNFTFRGKQYHYGYCPGHGAGNCCKNCV